MHTTEVRAERLGELLQNAGALAITFSDAAETPVLEPRPGETPIWPNTRLTALFTAASDLAPIREALLPHLTKEEIASWRVSELADRVWERTWLDHFHARRFGHRLWVCPRGETIAQKAAVVVHLDPGLAFGTGTHPTTALCLEWLDQADLYGKRVVDYGCGSGILAVAAAKLGAQSIHATDIDPQALTATRQNAGDNGVADRVHTSPPDALEDEPADIVLANILAGPLMELAPTLTGLLKPKGDLLLSGLLADQADAVKSAYRNTVRWCAVHESEGWAALHGVRRD
ncbi:MAG: 50S ribosomal protein L11 methyltransferase [Gammaproteobacteria bacterium]